MGALKDGAAAGTLLAADARAGGKPANMAAAIAARKPGFKNAIEGGE